MFRVSLCMGAAQLRMTQHARHAKLVANKWTKALACRKSILTDTLSFSHSCWAGISDDAKDFIATCLNRDWEVRPSAAQALQHRWLAPAAAPAASAAAPLASGVVARMQQYARRCARRVCCRFVLITTCLEGSRRCAQWLPALAASLCIVH